MFGWLIRTESGMAVDVADLTRSQLALADETEWHGIYLKGRKIGYAQSTTHTGDDRVLFTGLANYRVKTMGVLQTINTEYRIELSRQMQMRSFKFYIDAPGARFTAAGSVKDDQLHVSIETGHHADQVTISLTEPIQLPFVVRKLISQRRLKKGQTFRIPVYDPVTHEVADMMIDVRGEEQVEVNGFMAPAIHLVEKFRDLPTDVWIDHDGHTLLEKGGTGFESRQESKQQALAFSREKSGDQFLDLVALTFVPLTTDLGDPSTIKQLRFRLGGVSAELPADEAYQHRNADNIVVIDAVVFPHDSSSVELPAELVRFLRAESVVQSDDPKIRELAKKLVGTARSRTEQMQRLATWVSAYVADVPVAGVPSALDVLSTRKGDCNEHTVLFTALARAVGIPTRMTAGLVALDDAKRLTPGFYYHAWPEVWINGLWVPIDPTLNQVPAYPTHLALATGSFADQSKVVHWINQVEIDQVEVIR